jgi:hypothetical protein
MIQVQRLRQGHVKVEQEIRYGNTSLRRAEAKAARCRRSWRGCATPWYTCCKGPRAGLGGTAAVCGQTPGDRRPPLPTQETLRVSNQKGSDPLALGGLTGFVENPGPGPGRLGLLPARVVAVCPADRCIVACNDRSLHRCMQRCNGATVATMALPVGVCPCLSQDRCIVAIVATVARQSRCSAMQPPRGGCNDATTTNRRHSSG